jgi:peptidoglycan/LPS O-acetylase OafA/YrhL
MSFEGLRGIAIIAVIAIHASGYLPTNELVIGFRQLLNFAVPAFVFISGYWIGEIRDYRAFVSKRLTRILIPYLFWSLLVIIATHSYDSALFKLLTGSSLGPYYFILMLAQLYILAPVFIYLNHRSWGPATIMLTSALFLTGTYILRIDYDAPLYMYALPCLGWAVFFELGMLTRKKRYKIPTSMIILAAFIAILEGITIYNISNQAFAASAVKFGAFIYSASVVLLWRSTSFAHLGGYAFGIYLIHIPVLGFVHKYLPQIAGAYLTYAIIIVCTLAICVFVISIARRVLPQKIYLNLMGF